MKIKPQYFENLNAIDPESLEECQKGRWSHWKRSLVIKGPGEKVALVRLNIFERMLCSIKFFRANYLKEVLLTKDIQIISSKELQSTTKKTDKQAQKILSNKRETPLITQEEKTPLNQEDAQLQFIADHPQGPNRLEDIINLEGYSNSLNPEQLVLLQEKFETFKENNVQKALGHTFDPTQAFDEDQTIFLDFENFLQGQEIVDIGLHHLNQFVRYLVMQGKIFGYSEREIISDSKRDINFIFRLELKDPDPGTSKQKIEEDKKLLQKTGRFFAEGDQQRLLTKEHLTAAADYLAKLPKPLSYDIDKYEAMQVIRSNLFLRMTTDHPKKPILLSMLKVGGNDGQSYVNKKMLNWFLDKGTIQSWNIGVNGLAYVKLSAEDQIDERDKNKYSNDWEDLTTLQQAREKEKKDKDVA